MPKAFISSTCDDLKLFREAARDAALMSGFQPVMLEYFGAQGEAAPYKACMKKVASCDVLITIVAHRYGWVPSDQPDPDRTMSITWLECQQARNSRPPKEILAFIVDESSPWPSQYRESFRLERGVPAEEVLRNLAKLKDFKAWLSSLGFRGQFTDHKDLQTQVVLALEEWKVRHQRKQDKLTGPTRYTKSPASYLKWLREQTSWIDIRGLQVGSGKAYRFPINDLYIPLTMPRGDQRDHTRRHAEPLRLEDALRHHRLVIIGDPGAGKTTFLRWLSLNRCLQRLGEADGTRLGQSTTAFPILIRIAELEEHVRNSLGREGTPTSKHSPAWLVHFLGTQNREYSWNLSEEFFENRLQSKNTILLLDGLDEAPDRVRREDMTQLFENATLSYPNCQVVVTTRPAAYRERTVLSGFREAVIEELEEDSVNTFLVRWSECLFPGDPAGTERHSKELLLALRAREEIHQMARNPVMLTALAVVHWNERRLPEQRADLYESIVTWLARAREQRLGRESAERCIELLARLALEMQTWNGGRVVHCEKHKAAQTLAVHFRELAEPDRSRRARDFIDHEEVDSGLIVSRGPLLRFWHLTFQEYLAARAIAGLSEADQLRVVFSGKRLYSAEWREVLLLLAGTLLVKQGREKVDGFFNAILNRDRNPSLAARASCVALLGAILIDLHPLAYEPPGTRYHEELNAVLGIFDPTLSENLPYDVRLEAAQALGLAGDPRLRNENREQNWVEIPGGQFLMGSQRDDKNRDNFDPNAEWDEGPVHLVSVNTFRIGRYPVTVQEYSEFIDDNGYDNPAFWVNGGFGIKPPRRQNISNEPIEWVNWYEAAAYAKWAGCRLPTDIEWERAARGTDARMYPWGSAPPDATRVNLGKGKSAVATPVGLFPKGGTPEGIQDMVGNVWEWVDAWDQTKEARIMRGGRWSGDPRSLRAAYRGRGYPQYGAQGIGFRCVRDAN